MQLSSKPPHCGSGVTPSQAALPRPRDTAVTRLPDLCGWYDSSFDLAQGLHVVEQDNDILFQLWELSLS